MHRFKVRCRTPSGTEFVTKVITTTVERIPLILKAIGKVEIISIVKEK